MRDVLTVIGGVLMLIGLNVLMYPAIQRCGGVLSRRAMRWSAGLMVSALVLGLVASLW